MTIGLALTKPAMIAHTCISPVTTCVHFRRHSAFIHKNFLKKSLSSSLSNLGVCLGSTHRLKFTPLHYVPSLIMCSRLRKNRQLKVPQQQLTQGSHLTLLSALITQAQYTAAQMEDFHPQAMFHHRHNLSVSKDYGATAWWFGELLLPTRSV